MNQGERTMQRQKIISLIALFALVSLVITPAVSGVVSDYWLTHYIRSSDKKVAEGEPPNGYEYIFADTPKTSDTLGEMVAALGITGANWATDYRAYPNQTTVATQSNIFAAWNPAFTVSLTTSQITGPAQHFHPNNNDAMQIFVTAGGVWYPVGPLYIIQNQNQPVIADFTHTPAEPWIAPANVSFTSIDKGKKADDWLWEVVGPNFYVMSLHSPTFNTTLPLPGNYQVGLSVSNGTNENQVSDAEIKSFTVVNEAGSYSLTMSPETGTTATNFTAAITAGVDEIGAVLNQFTILCTESGKNSFCTVDGKDPVFVKQEDGNWYLDSDLYSATFPANIPLKFNIPGIHTVKAWFFTTDPTDTGTEVSDTITVTSSPGQIKLTVEVRDAGTNGLIGGSDILLKKEDGTWDNQTVGLGFRDYYINGGSNIGIGATAPGYTDSGIEYSRFYENAKKIVLLSRISGGVPEGNNTLSVYVRNGAVSDIVGLAGATVKLNDGQTKLTPASGLAQFLVLDAETYFITVSKPGYLTVSKYFAVNGAVNSVTIDMLVPGVTVTPTLAPGETPAPGTTTPAPGTTYPPGVPMPGTVTTYPPGVPVIGGDGGSVAGNATARDAAVRNLETWMLWGGSFLFAILVIMFIGFSGDALKKWSWLWK